MKIIGLTGGTGAGKTTALRAHIDMRAAVIDCDEVYHELLCSSKEMLTAIDNRFTGVLDGDKLNRKKLGKVVFASDEALLELMGITYPFITKAVSDKIEGFKQDGKEICAIDAIGLFESGISDICNYTVYVTAPADVRAKRIMEREGISYDYAMLRINSQKSDEYFKDRCDYVLVNDFEREADFTAYCLEFFSNILGGNKNG
jgi:dephospho-CoA kinase